jgi:hypothetical protein
MDTYYLMVPLVIFYLSELRRFGPVASRQSSSDAKSAANAVVERIMRSWYFDLAYIRCGWSSGKQMCCGEVVTKGSGQVLVDIRARLDLKDTEQVETVMQNLREAAIGTFCWRSCL